MHPMLTQAALIHYDRTWIILICHVLIRGVLLYSTYCSIRRGATALRDWLKGQASIYKFSKRKAWLIKFCCPRNINFKSWCQLSTTADLNSCLQRLSDLPQPMLEPYQICNLCKQTGNLGRETDQRLVCMNYLYNIYSVSTALAVSHTWNRCW